MLARVWAAENASTALRVNLFNPGPIRTHMRATSMPGEDPMTLKTPDDCAPALIEMCLPSWTANGVVYDFPTRQIVEPS